MSDLELEEYRTNIDASWSNAGPALVEAIRTSIGWPWNEPIIGCYVTGTRASFSDPLTLGYKPSTSAAMDLLTHELIHRYISQLIPALQEKLRALYALYPLENQRVRTHVAVHAIHEHVYRVTNRLGGLRADVSGCQSAPDYAKSWEIVQREGYVSILDRINAKEG